MIILNEVNTSFEKDYFNLNPKEVFISKIKSKEINFRNVTIVLNKKVIQTVMYDLNSEDEFKSYSSFYEKLLVEETEVWWP